MVSTAFALPELHHQYFNFVLFYCKGLFFCLMWLRLLHYLLFLHFLDLHTVGEPTISNINVTWFCSCHTIVLFGLTNLKLKEIWTSSHAFTSLFWACFYTPLYLFSSKLLCFSGLLLIQNSVISGSKLYLSIICQWYPFCVVLQAKSPKKVDISLNTEKNSSEIGIAFKGRERNQQFCYCNVA